MFVPHLMRQSVYGEFAALLSGETYEKISKNVIIAFNFCNANAR